MGEITPDADGVKSTRINDPIVNLDGVELFDTSEGPAVKMDCDSCESTILWLIAEPMPVLCECGSFLRQRGGA